MAASARCALLARTGMRAEGGGNCLFLCDRFTPLEFDTDRGRCAGRTHLSTFFISEAAARKPETLLVKELKDLGAAICVMVNRRTPRAQKAQHLHIELS